jgi:hypothetical protein
LHAAGGGRRFELMASKSARVSARRAVAYAAVLLSCGEFADAEFGETFFVALVDLLHGEIFRADSVEACLHRPVIIHRIGDHRTAVVHADAEFSRGGFAIACASPKRRTPTK